MMRTWQLQEAASRFGEVVEEAIRSGPQVILTRGVETAVLLSCADYRRLIGARSKLSTFLRESPLGEAPLDLHHDTSSARSEPTL
jgi:prevent-host-death family protein